MPDFIVKSKVTPAATEQTITADTREHAIEEVVSAAGDTDEVEILNVTEIVPIANPPPPSEGATAPDTQPAEAQSAASA